MPVFRYIFPPDQCLSPETPLILSCIVPINNNQVGEYIERIVYAIVTAHMDQNQLERESQMNMDRMSVCPA
jgi:hypothetical protein